MVAIVAGLVGLVLVVAGSAGSHPAAAGAPRGDSSVVMTARAIPVGAVLTAADVSVSRRPAPGPAVDIFLHSVREAVGRRSAVALPSGIPLVVPLLLDPRTPQPGHRVVRLHLDAGAVPPGLEVDDMVDVMAAIPDAQGGGGRVVTVASCRVVSVASDGTGSGSPTSSSVVTLVLDTDVVAAGRLLWSEAFAKSLEVLARPMGDPPPAPLDVTGLAA